MLRGEILGDLPSSPRRCAACNAEGFAPCAVVGGFAAGDISENAKSTSDASHPTFMRSVRTWASVRPSPLHFFM